MREDGSAGAALVYEQGLLAPFAMRRLWLPLLIFSASALAYLALISLAVLAHPAAAAVGYAVLAGVFTSTLAIIGHDAVHNSFTSRRGLNRVLGTAAFLPALHPFGRWEHHHNKVHHRYTAQLGVDNAFPPMTLADYQAASPARRAWYRFRRGLLGQTVCYTLDVWLPKMLLPSHEDRRGFATKDWLDFAIVYAWAIALTGGLTALAYTAGARGSLLAALGDALVFGLLIPFAVWNVFISFVTIVQHTGPDVRWSVATGRPSTFEQKLRGTVHVRLPESIDWFFHRVMQHPAHHVNPVVPLYALKAAETVVAAQKPLGPIEAVWTPAYHWRLTRICKLYDPERDAWCGFDGRPQMAQAAA